LGRSFEKVVKEKNFAGGGGGSLRIDFPGFRNGIEGGGGNGGRVFDPSPRDVGVDGPACAELVAIVGQSGRNLRVEQTQNHLAPVRLF
jgi:hypothetical protein